MERYRVKVHKKGLIVIPANVRKRFGIHEGTYLELVVEDNSIRLIVPRSLKDAFGVDGKRAMEVVKLIHASRRVEVEKEIRP
ncbi:MAG: AbrB family transcriptional regulator [Thermoprotei archaeon]|nr:MAG: AbrB family transcriptional regulator [Thermoprotei archaeon]RLF19276.1 MAG: AbrB family transcriptional regulator [Thermoprotei archaeon]